MVIHFVALYLGYLQKLYLGDNVWYNIICRIHVFNCIYLCSYQQRNIVKFTDNELADNSHTLHSILAQQS